jgi:hypothetical protein
MKNNIEVSSWEEEQRQIEYDKIEEVREKEKAIKEEVKDYRTFFGFPKIRKRINNFLIRIK